MCALTFLLTYQRFAEESAYITHQHGIIKPIAAMQHDYHTRTVNNQPIVAGISDNRQTFGNGGWTADDCRHYSRWVAENTTGLEEAPELSVIHSDDSDSVAATTGAILGLRHYDPKTAALYQRIVEK